MRVLLPTETAVVLGSTQPESHLDGARVAAAGLAVARRGSGGGAVLVGPGQVLWLDVVIPKGDPYWSDDVGRAFWWLGEVWAAALASVGVCGAEVWRRGLVRTPWSDRVCFAGRGPGEVAITGAKVVGMAQRRTRSGAHFQCAVPIRWQPQQMMDILDLNDAMRAEGAQTLANVAHGVGERTVDQLTDAFVARLSSAVSR
ncbi:MAG: lipoyl protein ligase domain-containing protein [Acidimicrobiales bacterium]